MICYVLAMGKQHIGPHVVVGYGIKIFWPGLFITSPDHLDVMMHNANQNTLRKVAGVEHTCTTLLITFDDFL